MRDHFLIGRFLKPYTSAYRYKQRPNPPPPSLKPQELENRLAARRRAFRLRQRRYAMHLQVGLLAALVLVISAFQLRLDRGDLEDYTPLKQELVTMEEIVQTRQQVKPPPPPRPPVPVEVPDDEIIEEEELDLDASLEIGEALAALPPPPVEEEEEVEEAEEDELFVVVEQMPEMIGGLEALLKDLEYPPLARKAGLKGMVVLHVIIDKEGKLEDVQVFKSVHKVLDEAAVEAVWKQRFRPGLQRNRPVRTRLSIPVHFRLTAD